MVGVLRRRQVLQLGARPNIIQIRFSSIYNNKHIALQKVYPCWCCVPRKFAVAKDPLLSYTLQGIPAVAHKHTIQTKQKPFILKLTTQYNPTSHLTLITTSSSTRIKCQTFSVATIERNSKLWASASRLIQHNSTSFS